MTDPARPARARWRLPEGSTVLVIGSGPIVIGQACEFDYSGTQACKALKALGYRVVLMNSNPATIMTDEGLADATYVEPLNLEAARQVIAREEPDAILPTVGGQVGAEPVARAAPGKDPRGPRGEADRG